MVARSLSLFASMPASTIRTPSGPMDRAMFPPSGQSNVPAISSEHVDVVPNRQDFQFGVRRVLRGLLPALLWGCGSGSDTQKQCSAHDPRGFQAVSHFSLFLISGYIVSAPARMTASGT